MTRSEKLCALFGSQSKLARAIGIDRSVVSRWKLPRGIGRGNGGEVPREYHNRIIDEAMFQCDRGDRDGLWYAEVLKCLHVQYCPTCGAEYQRGRVV